MTETISRAEAVTSSCLAKLAEDLLQRGQVHQLAEPADFVIGHHLAPIEHDDARAAFLGDFQHVRDVEDGLAPAGQLGDQLVEQECGGDVEPESGSSKISRSGSCSRAPAISTRCFIPLE